MADSQVHTVHVPGAALQVHDDGPRGAACVVMAHSIMTSAQMWAPQVPHLVSLGLRVLRLDSRGHGGSTHDGSALTIDRLAGDVVRVLDALKIERAHFIGLSLGGMVGFALGQQHAARLASLVICDARADSPPAFAAPWDERIAQARDRGMDSLVPPTLERWFGDRISKLDAAYLGDLRKAMAATSVQGYVETARALQGFDYTPRLAHMPPGATLVVGDLDGVLPQAMADLAARMPQAQLEVIPGTGHLPNAEQPAVFNAVLHRHLERVKG
jgi:3-oxoadipate enol-lactonase